MSLCVTARGIWVGSHVPFSLLLRTRILAPYGQVAFICATGCRRDASLETRSSARRHFSCSHPVGLGLAQWAFPGLQIVRDVSVRSSQHAAACTRDVGWLGQAMERSLSVSRVVDLEGLFCACARESLLGYSLREALSGTIRICSHSGRPLSGVSLGGVSSCTELSRAAVSVLISRNIHRLFECVAWA